MPLYEYAVIRVCKDGEEFRDLLVPITAVVARDEEHVRKIATRAIPLSEDPDILLEEAKILVRPFCPL